MFKHQILKQTYQKMKEIFLFQQNEKVLGIFDNFVKFRKVTFHHILDYLVKNNFFKTKLEAGKDLKKNFSNFYGKGKTPLEYKTLKWCCNVFVLNEIETDEKENQSVKEIYETDFTKLSILKGINNYKSINQSLAYLKLSPLYGK
jgi:hypothetical protein